MISIPHSAQLCYTDLGAIVKAPMLGMGCGTITEVIHDTVHGLNIY